MWCGSGFLAPGSVGQPAQDYWLMVYDYMSEGNGPVPLELKVRTQPKPPPKPTANHTLRSRLRILGPAPGPRFLARNVRGAQ